MLLHDERCYCNLNRNEPVLILACCKFVVQIRRRWFEMTRHNNTPRCLEAAGEKAKGTDLGCLVKDKDRTNQCQERETDSYQTLGNPCKNLP